MIVNIVALEMLGDTMPKLGSGGGDSCHGDRDNGSNEDVNNDKNEGDNNDGENNDNNDKLLFARI